MFRSPQLFPVLTILLNLGAAAAYALDADLRHTIYWLAAATLTATVTF